MSQQDKQMDKDLEEVLVRAGPRITPPDDMRARVYEATHSAWSDIPGEQGEQSAPASPNRWRPLSLALAASMLIGVVLMIAMPNRPTTQAPIAHVIYSSGAFTVDDSNQTVV